MPTIFSPFTTMLMRGLLSAMLVGPPGVSVALEAEAPQSVQPWQGRTMDSRGRPVSGARIWIVPAEDRQEPPLQRWTGPDGRFDLPSLAAGPYHVQIDAFGYRSETRILIFPLTASWEIVLEPEAIRLAAVLATVNPSGRGTAYQPVQQLQGDDLLRRIDLSVGAMLDGEPGIAMRSLGPVPARPVIRGLGGDRILVLEDGERMGDLAETAADHAVAIDPLAIRRIEVVRGPASLLHGSSAIGGVINLQAEDLSTQWTQGTQGSVIMQGTSVNRGGGGHAKVRYGSETWTLHGRLGLRETGNVRTPEARLLGTEMSSGDAQMGVAWRNGGHTATLSISGLDRRYGVPEDPDNASEEIEIWMDRTLLRGRWNWEPAGTRWVEGIEIRTHLSRYRQDEIERTLGFRNQVIEEDIGLFFRQDVISIAGTIRHRQTGPLEGGALGWSIRTRILDVGGNEAYTPGVHQTSLGVFAFEEAPLSTTFRLQFGVRGELNRDAPQSSDRFTELPTPNTRGALSASAGILWTPAPAWAAGTQVARSHRNPAVEERFANGPHPGAGTFELGDPDLGDERGIGVDFFLRLDRPSHGFEVALFSTQIKDFVAFFPQGRVHAASGLPVFQYRAAQARMEGGEISGFVRSERGLTLEGGLDWVKGSQNQIEGAEEPLPSIPPMRGRIAVRQDRAWGWIGLSIREVAAQNRVAPEENPTAGYTLIDADMVARLSKNGLLLLRVENLGDALYRDHLSRVEGRGFPMPGRNLSLAIQWDF